MAPTNPSTNPQTVVGDPSDPILAPSSRYASAYEQHRAEMLALGTSELVAVNLDVPSATTLVTSHLRGIRALREAASALPGFDLARFDALETCTRAVVYAHARYLIAAAPVPILPELNEAAVSLRDQLATEVGMLAHRGLVERGRIGELKGPIGYKNVALDLMAVASLLRESWAEIVGKTAIEPSDIDRAERLADELLTAVAAREEKPEKVAEAALDRQRAFTLFSSTYDHVRRAVNFLRWDEGDADAIAPSLFAGRSGGRRKEREAPAVEPSAPSTGAAAMSPDDLGLPDGNPFTA